MTCSAPAPGAAATLVGLPFVAVTLNHERVLGVPTFPALVARSLGVLLGLLLMSILVLAPEQPRVALGAELTTLGAVLVTALTMSAVRTHIPVTRWRWTITTMLLVLSSSAPMPPAGVTVIIGAGGALYGGMAELLIGFSTAVYYAWILLIEIKR